MLRSTKIGWWNSDPPSNEDPKPITADEMRLEFERALSYCPEWGQPYVVSKGYFEWLVAQGWINTDGLFKGYFGGRVFVVSDDGD